MKWIVIMAAALLLLGSVKTAQAQSESSPAEEEWPSAVETESSAAPQQEEWPSAVETEAEAEDEGKPKNEKWAELYSKKVQGGLWVEAFAGPSSYDPDRFKNELLQFFGPTLDLPTLKGPEFGVAFGGALADDSFFLGAFYRQANYDTFKLMKTGMDMQILIRTPYVHPLVRIALGYSKWFGSNFSDSGLRSNGFVGTVGGGVRVPIIRWISFLATFDWSGISMIFKSSTGGSGSVVLGGRQFTGTFALTFHPVAAKK